MGDFKEVLAVWQGGFSFQGSNNKGGKIQIGSIDDQPGVGSMELILLGLAGCSGSDIVMILEKKKQKITDFHIRVTGIRAEAHPRVYTHIDIEFLLWGENIDENSVQRAIQLSEDKYCSVSNMLIGSVQIRSKYTINPIQHVEMFHA